MPRASTSAAAQKIATLMSSRSRNRFNILWRPLPWLWQSIDGNAAVDQAHGDIVAAKHLTLHRLEPFVLVREELQRMREAHHLDERSRQRRPRRARVIEVLRIEQHPLRVDMLVGQRWSLDARVEVDRTVFRGDLRNDIARESLLQRLMEIPSRLDDKRRRARRHDPRRPASPLEEFNGDGGRRKTEEGHELTRLPAHDDEHVQNGGGKPEAEIDEGGTHHPHESRLAPAQIPFGAAQ